MLGSGFKVEYVVKMIAASPDRSIQVACGFRSCQIPWMQPCVALVGRAELYVNVSHTAGESRSYTVHVAQLEDGRDSD